MKHIYLTILLLLSIVTGCSTLQVYIDVPPSLEEAKVVESHYLQSAVAEIFPDRVVRIGDIEDTQYSIPTHETIISLLKWAAVQRDHALPRNGQNRVYQSQTGDCDNFARWAVFGADLGALRGRLSGQVLVSRFNVMQLNAFGQVPAGGAHALNWFASDRGIWVFEPQSFPASGSIAQVAKWESGVGSRLIPVNDYPNLDGVYYVKFD
jgi:hypothetical protein